MKLRITRREALHRISTSALALTAGLSGLVACAPSAAEVETRLAAGLARLSDSRLGPEAIAAAAPLTHSDATARLRGDASAPVLWAATSSGFALRAFLARRHEADLRAGHVRWVHGWLLTETEIAAATLAAG